MMNVVIVDDELNIIELIRHMLDPGLAMVVGVALNGIDAFECVMKAKPDILITDVRMPGYSGLQLIEKVKTSMPSVDIVVISGYREFDYLQSILRFGVQEFLLKPVDGDELNATIRHIEQRRSAANNRAQYIRDMEINLSQSYERLREEYTLKMLYDDVNSLEWESPSPRLFSFQPGNYCVAILKADCPLPSDGGAAGDLPYVKTLLRGYRDSILNAFRQGCFDVTYATHRNKVYFIFNYDAGLSADEFWSRPRFNKLYISDMLVTENYKYGFLHFSLGIGVSVDGLEKLGTSMRSALRSIGNRLNPYSSGVIECRAPAVEDARAVPDAEFRNGLSNAILAMDERKVMEILEALIHQCARGDEYHRIFDIANAAIDIARSVVILHNLIDEKDYAGLGSQEDSLDNCYTVQMVIDLLRQHFAKLIGTIREISDNRASKPIRIALEYMRRNFAEQITLQSVADIIYYSPNYFSNAFKKQTGKTFLEYLTDLRMEAAQELLKNTLKGIGEIAHEVGYSDEKYFSKLFTNTVGIKPNEYRKFYS